jgi:hypothetical protein
MFTKILDWLFNKTVIRECSGAEYLHRWYVLKSYKLCSVFIHKFVLSDETRGPHDHPWNFISIILWRGYYEWTPTKQNKWMFIKRRKWPGMILFRRAEHKHRVELVDGKPAVTLIIRFRRRRVWGYHMPDGWIAHDQWWAKNCE